MIQHGDPSTSSVEQLGLSALGDGIHLAQHRYDYTNAALEALKSDIDLPNRLHAAVARRQIDYLAGRYCARKALRDAGFEAPPPVTTGEHGAPVWPAGFLGSISHCNGWALAAVARVNCAQAIGIDMEESMTAELAQSICKQIVGEAELRFLETQPLPTELALTLAFSAKESLFKALYPTVRRYFDFTDAEIVAVDHQAGSLVLRLANSISGHRLRNMSYGVHFTWQEGRVLTHCVVGLTSGTKEASNELTSPFRQRLFSELPTYPR